MPDNLASSPDTPAVAAVGGMSALLASVPPQWWPLIAALAFGLGGGAGTGFTVLDRQQVEAIVGEQLRAHETREEAARQADMAQLHRELGLEFREALAEERERTRSRERDARFPE